MMNRGAGARHSHDLWRKLLGIGSALYLRTDTSIAVLFKSRGSPATATNAYESMIGLRCHRLAGAGTANSRSLYTPPLNINLHFRPGVGLSISA